MLLCQQCRPHDQPGWVARAVGCIGSTSAISSRTRGSELPTVSDILFNLKVPSRVVMAVPTVSFPITTVSSESQCSFAATATDSTKIGITAMSTLRQCFCMQHSHHRALLLRLLRLLAAAVTGAHMCPLHQVLSGNGDGSSPRAPPPVP